MDTLSSYFELHKLDKRFLRELKPISRWWNRWRAQQHLVCPHKIYRLRDEIDQEILYDRKFIPIGHCANGDFIIVPVSNEWPGLTPGRVYYLAMELASVNNELIVRATREVAKNINDFVDRSRKRNLPMSYWQENPDAYYPKLKKRKKRTK